MAGIEPRHLDFSGRRVLVTGAAGGLGGRMARAFHAHGGTGRARRPGHRGGLAPDRRPRSAAPSATSTTNPTPLRSRRSPRAAEPVDILLNNAGISPHSASFIDLPPHADRARSSQRTSPARSCSPARVARGMVERRASESSSTPRPRSPSPAGRNAWPSTATAKAGLVQFTRAAAVELAPHRVRVVALAPGTHSHPAHRGRSSPTPSYLAASLARIPAGRLGDAEEMARLALFLASPAADYVVGETLIADGGYILA